MALQWQQMRGGGDVCNVPEYVYLSAVAGIFARGLVFFCFLAKWCPDQFASETHKKKRQCGDFHHNCKQPCNEMILQRMAFEAFYPGI